jgi:hypothetical protein
VSPFVEELLREEGFGWDVVRSEASLRRRMTRRLATPPASTTTRKAPTMSGRSVVDLDEAAVAPEASADGLSLLVAAPEPPAVPPALPLPAAAAATVVVVVVGGVVVVVVEGSRTLSSDSAVPDSQLTGLPPTACQVSPVT